MRILVVEDEHKIANSIKKGLEQESFSVDVAYNGIDGFDLASTEDYDLIILDLMLPEMTGLEVCLKLREKKNHTPIIILTAKSEIEDKIEGLNCGADDYLTKPFAFEELLARTRAIIRRPKNLLENKLSCGGLDLDIQNLTVTRYKKDILLSRREFSLLEYLLRNKEKILTKDQIISHVWDYDSDILPNTVEQYMGYLRNKIDKPFPKKINLVRTIRGFGYKISEMN